MADYNDPDITQAMEDGEEVDRIMSIIEAKIEDLSLDVEDMMDELGPDARLRKLKDALERLLQSVFHR